MINQIRVFGIAALTSLLAACGDNAKLPEQASEGANPPLPPPQHSMIPVGVIIDSKGTCWLQTMLDTQSGACMLQRRQLPGNNNHGATEYGATETV